MEKVWAEIWEASAAADDGDWPELPTPPAPPLRGTQDRCEVPLAALVRPVKLRGAKAKGVCFVVFAFQHALTNAIKKQRFRGPSLSSCRR
jgi:hypothetical protein